jgi:hypothetical protein
MSPGRGRPSSGAPAVSSGPRRRRRKGG